MLTVHATPVRGSDAPVGQLLQRSPVFVSQSLTLRQTAEVLEADAIGAVLVRVHGKLAGLVSERDIVRALADGADPDSETVLDVMADDLVTVAVGEPVSTAADLMLRMEIRHIPVLDDGIPVGVLSIRDLLGVLQEAPTAH